MLDAAVPCRPNGQRLRRTTIDDSSERMGGNKEPWLTAALPWQLPGAGHVYCRFRRSATALIFLSLLLSITALAILMALQVPLVAFTAALLCAFALRIGSSVAAFRTAWKRNTGDFERFRTSEKDPWLAVFLSLILPGPGHVYLRRWITGELLIATDVALRLPRGGTPAFLAAAGLRVLAPFVAYFQSIRAPGQHDKVAALGRMNPC